MDFSQLAAEQLHQSVTILYGLDAEEMLHTHPHKDEAVKQLAGFLAKFWGDAHSHGYSDGRDDHYAHCGR